MRKKKIEKNTTIKNIKLLGLFLTADQVTTESEVTYEGNRILFRIVKREEIEPLVFKLREVDRDEIPFLRRNNVPGFLLKEREQFYYSPIPDNISFVGADVGVYACAKPGMECNRLSAAPDELGGCKRVRDIIPKIETYPWVLSGFQTLNFKNNSLIVTKCSNYEKILRVKKT